MINEENLHSVNSISNTFYYTEKEDFLFFLITSGFKFHCLKDISLINIVKISREWGEKNEINKEKS